jgi:hypothetical protein
MPVKLALPWMGRTSKDVVKYYNERAAAPAQTPEGLNFQPDVTEIKESRPFPDPDVFEVYYDSEVDETWEGKIWKKALQQEAKMQYRVFSGKSPSAAPGEPDWEPDPNVVDLTWVDKLQKRLRELGTDLPDNSSEFTGMLEYRPEGLDTDDIPSAAIEDPLEDVETHTEDRWVPDYVGAGLGLDNEDPMNPQWTLRHSNHPLTPFPGEALKWESFVYDDGTTYVSSSPPVQLPHHHSRQPQANRTRSTSRLPLAKRLRATPHQLLASFLCSMSRLPLAGSGRPPPSAAAAPSIAVHAPEYRERCWCSSQPLTLSDCGAQV